MFLFVCFSNAQDTNESYKDKFKKAEYFFMDEEYWSALDLYLELYKEDTANYNIAFRIGESYLKEQLVFKAIEYLKHAELYMASNYKEGSYKERRSSYFTLFLLGKCYQTIKEFDLAVNYYNAFKENIKKNRLYYYDIVENQIKSCERAKKFISNPVSVEIENIGNIINTGAYEVVPLVSANDERMIFARKDYSEETIIEGEVYSGIAYRIFYAKKKDEIWNLERDITEEISSNGYYIPVSLSADGTKLILFKDNYNNGGFEEFDMGALYYSDFSGGKWGAINKFPEPINSKHWESSACLSSDGNTMYIAAERKDSRGGFDLYESKLEDGEWSEPQNLGDEINTDLHEDFPTIIGDSLLIFTSEKHDNIGGYDIFLSKKIDNEWTTPVNLGYPINSTGDEMRISPCLGGRKAYFSVLRPDGYFTFGRSDIYAVSIFDKDYIDESAVPDSIQEEITDSLLIAYTPPSNNVIRKETILEGSVVSTDYNKISEPVKVTVIDVNSKNTVATVETKPDENDKQNYSVAVEPGEYSIVVETKDHISSDKKVFIPPKINTASVAVKSSVSPISDQGKDYYMIKPVFFDYGKSDLTVDATFELEHLAEIMKANPSLYLEVSGHTDSISSYSFNKRLSIDRATSVIQYLVSLGVDGLRFVKKGFSYERNIATNTMEEGRRYNRRVEIRIIKSNNESISIQEIVVPDYLTRKSRLQYTVVVEDSQKNTGKQLHIIAGQHFQNSNSFDANGKRYYYTNYFTKKSEAMLILNDIVDAGFSNAELNSNYDLEEMKAGKDKYTATHETGYTLQLLALEYACDMQTMFEGIDDVKEYECSDGYYRYTVGSYASEEEAQRDLRIVNSFWDEGVTLVSVDKLKNLLISPPKTNTLEK